MDLFVEGFQQAIAKLLAPDPELVAAAAASLVVTGSATALSIVTGVPLGAAIGMLRFRGRTAVLALANTGMGLPPVVVGLFVSVMLWRTGPLGELGWFCTRQAMIAAQYVLAVPVVVGLSAAAVQSLDPMLALQLRSLGASRWQTLVLLAREARLAILTAAMAGFGAVISEIGASLMTGCNIRGDTRILTTEIVFDTSRGDFGSSFALAFILLALIFAVNAVTTWAQQRERPA